MAFITQLAIAIAILLLGCLLIATSDRASLAGDFYFLVGTIGAQVWLFTSAIRLRSKRLPRFDMLVASELIIALGILSLILGIINSVVFAFQGGDRFASFSKEALQPLLTPFAVGLLAAGVAPVLATLLRQLEVLKYADGKDEDSTSEAEFESLKTGSRDAAVVLGNFTAACELSRSTFEKTATSFNKSADTYDAAAAKIQAALGHLADVTAAGSDRVAAGLEAMTNNLANYEKKLAHSAREMSSLAEATGRFRTAAEEGATLLTGLQKVIESVERFIRPHRSP